MPNTDPAQHALDDQNTEAARADQRQRERAREQTPEQEQQGYSGSRGSALGPENDDLVTEASAESFPASDPPSWTPERA
jgi:hypothetical protein